MSENLKSLNVNPCKMCMPMGAVTALYGIRKCMSILHGSQGCSTYIRRHMATHYNEPVDIASSSLTEQGTVFGGADNLKKGLQNLLSLYAPEVIGVTTTCLAETIGEDIGAMIREFKEENPDCAAQIITVPAAGYAGTQYEGFFRALRAIVSSVEMDASPNGKINIVTGQLSPADTRWLKKLLSSMGLSYILLPDLSENLDAIHAENYNRLPQQGTPLSEIQKMAGARATIELSLFSGPDVSAGEYLQQIYGVPLYRLAPPMGLRDTDALIKALEALGGVLPEEVKLQRGRLLDAMVDAHKHCAAGRAVIFGEPDFVFGMARLCCENGVAPVVAATGTRCPALKGLVEPEIREVCQAWLAEKYDILDFSDFEDIQTYAVRNGANLMIGSSDGRRIEEKAGISLIRCAFPIHDRMGGQRVRTLGYGGALSMLDEISNLLLSRVEESFREELKDKYYREDHETNGAEVKKQEKSIEEKTRTHPCYNCGAHEYARIHLPVAPKCNIQCNYCVRKFDCPNESRPGVTTKVLGPQEALARYREVKGKVKNLSVVGIAGPGDSLADFENTKKTLELIRREDPDVTFCLSTNGLMLPVYAAELARLGVSHVTVTMNAVDPAVGGKIYKYIHYMGVRYEGEQAAAILMANQLAGLALLRDLGIICKVNIVALKGINDAHIEQVVKKVRELGVHMTNIMQMIPVQGSAFEGLPLVSRKELDTLRDACGIHLKQMYHCRQCRADAVGTLDDDQSLHLCGESGNIKSIAQENTAVTRFAAASKSGMAVDEHFGQAETFYIFESVGADVRFVEARRVEKYCSGGQDCDGKEDKMERILAAVSDCQVVMALRAGDAPTKMLSEQGIRMITTYDLIENAIRAAMINA